MSGENTRACGTPILKDFAFVNPQVQKAANMVYTQKQNFDSDPTNVALKRTYTFKSDFERMQYKLGTLGASRNGGGGCGTGQK